MKLSLLVTAALSAKAFAAPQGVPKATETGDLANTIDTVEHATDFNTTISLNETHPALTAFLGAENRITVKIWGKPQHVGQYHGQKMWNMVHHGLETLCRLRSQCDGWPFNEHRVNEVEYKDQKDRLATNAHLKLSVNDYNWPMPPVGNYNEDIFQGLLDAVAYTYKAATDNDKNCIDYELNKHKGKGKVRAYHCQVGQYVRVEAKGSVRQLALETTLQFNGKTKPSRFICNRHEMTHAVYSYMNSNVVPRLLKGDPKSGIKNAYVICA